jgi:uncharacterized membrane protein YhaH (DUF805 family)
MATLLFRFQGRATRSTFWLVALCLLVIGILVIVAIFFAALDGSAVGHKPRVSRTDSLFLN